MRKPQFGVVIALLSVFFLLALIRNQFEKYIPPLPPNKLDNQPGEFLRSAVHEPIDWQPKFDKGLSEARRLQKPCLVVLGRMSSRIGRLMDQRVFSNWAVAARMNSSFVPVRIDLSDQPKWSPAVFPISRMKIPFVTDFQIIVLDSNGIFRKFLSPPQDLAQIDPTQFLDQLVATKTELENRDSTEGGMTDASVQQEDLAELSSTEPIPVPEFNHYANNLTALATQQYGAFMEPGYLKMLPNAWLYLARVGKTEEARRSLLTFIFSPASDMLRGGFYNIDESPGTFSVDFSEETVPNAEMASTIAEISLLEHEQVLGRFAKTTFDMLLRDLRPQRLFVTCRPSDLDETTGQSAETSFPESRMNELLDPKENAWAVDHFHLDRSENRQMIPYIDQVSTISDPMYPQVITKLRSGLTREGEIAGDQYLDVNGETIAALCRCCRLLNDRARFYELFPSAGELDRFARKEDVTHTPDSKSASDYVGDYLAYSDAELQLFLATGDSIRFDRGLATLQRAINRFYDPESEQMLSVLESQAYKMPRGFDNPDLCDDIEESTSAQAVRLCIDYGRMLGPTPTGDRLVELAAQLVEKNANLSCNNSPSMAAFYNAATGIVDGESAFVVGRDAKEVADKLFRLRPTRLVAPVTESVRPDLLNKPAGIYLCSGSSVVGPFTLPQAAKNLPLTLQVGLPPKR